MHVELKNKGNSAFQTGAYTEAIRLFTDAIDLNPNDHILYSNRSGAYASNGEYVKAKQDAFKCISLNPQFAKGYGRLGLALYFLKEYKDSIKAYEKGLAIDSQNETLLAGKQKAEDALCATSPNPKLNGKRKETEKETPSAVTPDGRKKFKEMSKSELISAFETSSYFKEKNELKKILEEFPADPLPEDDLRFTKENVTMKEWPTPQAFQCIRCDRPKISTMKGSFEGKNALCNSCHDHLTRCVIPYRNNLDKKPERCMHQVPKGYQKQYR
jgi:tetratricopeptide (TPR) repeat protein